MTGIYWVQEYLSQTPPGMANTVELDTSMAEYSGMVVKETGTGLPQDIGKFCVHVCVCVYMWIRMFTGFISFPPNVTMYTDDMRKPFCYCLVQRPAPLLKYSTELQDWGLHLQRTSFIIESNNFKLILICYAGKCRIIIIIFFFTSVYLSDSIKKIMFYLL